MSAERITLLESRITALDAAKADFALGKSISKQSYSGHSVEYLARDAGMIERQLRQDQVELNRLKGRPSPFRARTLSY